LAKFRELMIMGKVGAVIGWKARDFVCALPAFSGNEFFQPITAPCLPTIIKSRHLAKRQY
jgi:hypothetical protein